VPAEGLDLVGAEEPSRHRTGKAGSTLTGIQEAKLSLNTTRPPTLASDPWLYEPRAAYNIGNILTDMEVN
jgi:hypothetical protein